MAHSRTRYLVHASLILTWYLFSPKLVSGQGSIAFNYVVVVPEVVPCQPYEVRVIVEGLPTNGTPVEVIVDLDLGVQQGGTDAYMEAITSIAPSIGTFISDATIRIQNVTTPAITVVFQAKLACDYPFNDQVGSSPAHFLRATAALDGGLPTSLLPSAAFTMAGPRFGLLTDDLAWTIERPYGDDDNRITRLLRITKPNATEPYGQRIILRDDHSASALQYTAFELRVGTPSGVVVIPASTVSSGIEEFVISAPSEAYTAIISAAASGVVVKEVLDITSLCFPATGEAATVHSTLSLGWSCSSAPNALLCDPLAVTAKIKRGAKPNLVLAPNGFTWSLVDPPNCYSIDPPDNPGANSPIRTVTAEFICDAPPEADVFVRGIRIGSVSEVDTRTDLVINADNLLSIRVVRGQQTIHDETYSSIPPELGNGLFAGPHEAKGCSEEGDLQFMRAWGSSEIISEIPPLMPGDRLIIKAHVRTCFPQSTSTAPCFDLSDIRTGDVRITVGYDLGNECNSIAAAVATGYGLMSGGAFTGWRVAGAYQADGGRTSLAAVRNAENDVVTNMVTNCFDQSQPYDLAFRFGLAPKLIRWWPGLPTDERIGIFLDLEPGLYVRTEDLEGEHPLEIVLNDNTVLSTRNDGSVAEEDRITVQVQCALLDCPETAINGIGWGIPQRVLFMLPDQVLELNSALEVVKITNALLQLPVRMHCPGDPTYEPCQPDLYFPGCAQAYTGPDEFPQANAKLSLVHFPNAGSSACSGLGYCTRNHIVLACHQQTYYLQCPGCTRVGIHSNECRVYRTTYGDVDFDDDGFPDDADANNDGTLDGSRHQITWEDIVTEKPYTQGVATSLAMFSDEIAVDLRTDLEMHCTGYGPCDNDNVNENFEVTPILKHLYYNIKVPSVLDQAGVPVAAPLLQLQRIELEMTRDDSQTSFTIAAPAVILEIAPYSFTEGQHVFRLDLSPSRLLDLQDDIDVPIDECKWFDPDEEFTFNDWDQAEIRIRTYFRVTHNISASFQQVYIENDIYLGARPETEDAPLEKEVPEGALDFDDPGFCESLPDGMDCDDFQYYCTRKSGTFTLAGFRLTRSAGNGFSTNIACGLGPSITYRLELGENPPTYYGDNLFSHEYRNWFRLADVRAAILGSAQEHWGDERVEFEELVRGLDNSRTGTLGGATVDDPAGTLSNRISFEPVPYYAGEFGPVANVPVDVLIPPDDDFSLILYVRRAPEMNTPTGNLMPAGGQRHAYEETLLGPLYISSGQMLACPPGTCNDCGCSEAYYHRPTFASTATGEPEIEDAEDAIHCWESEFQVRPADVVNVQGVARTGAPWIAIDFSAGLLQPTTLEYQVNADTDWITVAQDPEALQQYQLPLESGGIEHLSGMLNGEEIRVKACFTYDCWLNSDIDLYLGWSCAEMAPGSDVDPEDETSYLTKRSALVDPVSRELDLSASSSMISLDDGGARVQIDLHNVGSGSINDFIVGLADITPEWTYEPGSARLWELDAQTDDWLQIAHAGSGGALTDPDLAETCPLGLDPPGSACLQWSINPEAFLPDPVPTRIAEGLLGGSNGNDETSWLRVTFDLAPTGCASFCPATPVLSYAQALACRDQLRSGALNPPTPSSATDPIELSLALQSPITNCQDPASLDLNITNTTSFTVPVGERTFVLTMPSGWAVLEPGWSNNGGGTWSLPAPALVPATPLALSVSVQPVCSTGVFNIELMTVPVTASSCDGCASSPVVLQISLDNNAPTAQDDAWVTTEGDPPLVATVVANDSDPDNDPLIWALVNGGSAVAHGQLTFNADGSFIFTPNQGFTGSVSFQYSVCDLSAACDQAIATILVTPASTCPILATVNVVADCNPPEDNDCAVLPIQGDDPIDANTQQIFPAFTATMGSSTNDEDYLFDNGWGIFNEYAPQQYHLVGGAKSMQDPSHVVWLGLYLTGPYDHATWNGMAGTTVQPFPPYVGTTWEYFLLDLDPLANSRMVDYSTGTPIEYQLTQGALVGFQKGLGANGHNVNEGFYGVVQVNGQTFPLTLELDCERDLPNNGCSGRVTVDITAGTPPLSVSIEDGQGTIVTTQTANVLGPITFIDLCAHDYTVVIAQQGEPGCSIDLPAAVPAVEAFEFTVDYDPEVCGVDRGWAIVNLAPGYPNPVNITWYWTGSQITVGPGDLLTGIATDEEAWFAIHDPLTGCWRSHKIFIHAGAGSIELDVSTVPSSCGVCDGQATVAWTGAQGNTLVIWSNGSTSETITDLCPGSYSVTVADAQGCTTTAPVTIDEGAGGPQVIVEAQDPTCPKFDDGRITLYTDPEVGFTVQWDDGSQEPARQDLTPGTYHYTITTEQGCTIEGDVTLEEGVAFAVIEDVHGPICPEEGVGSIVLSTEPPVDFEVRWDDGARGSVREDLRLGEYGYWLYTTDGCKVRGSITLEQEPPFTLLIIWPEMNEPEQPECIAMACVGVFFGEPPQGLSPEEMMALAQEGWSGYDQPEHYGRDALQYMWSNGSTEVCAYDLCGPDIAVVVTDPFGCFDKAFATLGGKSLRQPEPQGPDLVLSPNPFFTSTMLSYTLPTDCHARLEVSTTEGKPVVTLLDEQRSGGRHTMVWETAGLAPGVYFCALILDGGVTVRRAVKLIH